MAKYQGYAQRKAYQGSKANLQQPKFQSRFNQDEFAAQQAPREGLTRLQEFHRSVIKSADQHRQEVYNVATNYLTQTKQNQANEANVVRKNQQLRNNLFEDYAESLRQNQEIHTANAELEIEEIKSRSDDLQGLITGVSNTLIGLEKKRDKAIKSRALGIYLDPESEEHKQLSTRLNIAQDVINRNDKIQTDLRDKAYKNGEPLTVIRQINRARNKKEYYFLKFYLQDQSKILTEKFNAYVKSLSSEEQTEANIDKLTAYRDQLFEESGITTLGRELSVIVTNPLNKTVSGWMQHFRAMDIDRGNQQELAVAQREFVNGLEEDNNPSMSDLYYGFKSTTKNGLPLTHTEALSAMLDYLSKNHDPADFQIEQLKLQDRSGVGGAWGTAQIDGKDFFEEWKKQYNDNFLIKKGDQDKENEKTDNENLTEIQKEINKIDDPQERLKSLITARDQTLDSLNNDNGNMFPLSLEWLNKQINHVVGYKSTNLDSFINHLKVLGKKTKFREIYLYIDKSNISQEKKNALLSFFLPTTQQGRIMQSLAEVSITDAQIEDFVESEIKKAHAVDNNNTTFKKATDEAKLFYYDRVTVLEKELNLPEYISINAEQWRKLDEQAKADTKAWLQSWDRKVEGTVFEIEQFVPNTGGYNTLRRQITNAKQIAGLGSAFRDEPILTKSQVEQAYNGLENAYKENRPVDYENDLGIPIMYINALKLANIPIERFLYEQLSQLGEVNNLIKPGTQYHITSLGDPELQPTYIKSANSAKTNKDLFNLERWWSLRLTGDDNDLGFFTKEQRQLQLQQLESTYANSNWRSWIDNSGGTK